MADKRHTRRGGFYWMNKRPYISVTHILKVIDKPALRYWFGREVYYAMVEDPTLAEPEAMKAPWNKSGKAKNRGSTVHSFIEGHRQGIDIEKIVTTMPPNIRDYGRAFYKWVTDNHVKFIEHERTVLSNKYGYGGTADFRCRINKRPEIWLIDGKTGKDIYDEVELQLSAYKQGHTEMKEKVDRLGVLLLKTGQDDKPTGTYKFEEKKDQLDVFLAAKKLWEWQNQGVLAKIKYYDHFKRG